MVSFSKNDKVAAKCCKTVLFAANDIISKVLHQILPKLVYWGS